jgi:hypothetical protein
VGDFGETMQVGMTTYFDDWKRFCLVLREIAVGTNGQPLSGIEAQTRAQAVLAEAGYRWLGYRPAETPADGGLETNQPDIYAIRRTFAELYGVSIDSVHVVRNAENTIVLCAGKTFISHGNSRVCEFVSEDEDPVTVALAADERSHLRLVV